MSTNIKIFHLTTKPTATNHYYGSLQALCDNNPNMGISKFTLDRFDFDKFHYENEIVVIRKGVLIRGGKPKQ